MAAYKADRSVNEISEQYNIRPTQAHHGKSELMKYESAFLPSSMTTTTKQSMPIATNCLGKVATNRLDFLKMFGCFSILEFRKMIEPNHERRSDREQSLCWGHGGPRFMNNLDHSKNTILYLAEGSKRLFRARPAPFSGRRTLQLDNFRTLCGYGWPGFRTMKLRRQDKGQRACVTAFLDAVKGQAPPPIPFEEILEVSRVSIELAQRS